MKEEKYEFIADQIGMLFLKQWAVSTQDIDCDIVDDLAMYCMFDGI